MKEIQAIVDRLCRDWKGGVLVTLVTVEGSSYRRAGARILVPDGGARIGSISGGCLEEDLILRSARVAEAGRSELVTYDKYSFTTQDGVQGEVDVALTTTTESGASIKCAYSGSGTLNKQ